MTTTSGVTKAGANSENELLIFITEGSVYEGSSSLMNLFSNLLLSSSALSWQGLKQKDFRVLSLLGHCSSPRNTHVSVDLECSIMEIHV